MSREMKTITKIIITILIALGILLILPKTINANDELGEYQFNSAHGNFRLQCYTNNYYALAHELINANKISDVTNWNINDNINVNTPRIYLNGSWRYEQEKNDGWYMMGGGKSPGTTNFVKNIYCVEQSNSGRPDSQDGVTGKISHIIDIYPDRIVWNGKEKKGSVLELNKWAYVLYKSYNSTVTWQESGKDTLQDGKIYTYNHLSNIQESLSKAYNGSENSTCLGIATSSGYSDNTFENDSRYENIYHARIYVIGGTTIYQARIVFRADKVEEPEVKLTFNKQNFTGSSLSGAIIKVEPGANVENISGSSEKYLSIGTETVTVKPKENTGTFQLKVTETRAPSGYTGLSGTVTLTVKYNKSTGSITSITSSNTENVSISSSTVTIKNKPKIGKLILLKQDSLAGTNLAGATFKITLTNVESIGSYSTGGTKSGKIILTGIKTGSNGQLVINDLVIADESKNVTITIEETSAPAGGYKKIDGKITVTLKRNGTSYTTHTSTKDSTVLDKEFTAGNVPVSGNQISLTIKNIPLITLSGIVWNDGQTGVKDATPPNGEKDSGESGIDGVRVGLYSVRDKKVIDATYTANGGKYEFKDIEKTNEGYQIIFGYDGINYQETKSLVNKGTDSKATENGRTEFDANFKTISKDTSNSGVRLGYNYDSDSKKSTLQVNINGANPANNNQIDFRITATTPKCTNTTTNVDCGLVKKEIDLALGTDVKSAELKINDKSVTYDYAQIMNGDMDDLDLDALLQGKSSDQNVTYNLYLYKSDYNYRISDYKTDAITNTVNPGDNNVNANDYEGLKELEAYVTYSVILKNQTKYEATVDEFVYYYDEIYTPYNIKSTDKYDVSIDTAERKITFTSKNDGFKLTDPDYRVEIDLTFSVNKDSAGNINLKENCTNIAEITKYSTEKGGLIDRDSAPGNGITNGKITQYEDDTDQAAGINISLKNNERTITGTVFEDTNKDGISNDNKPVNDVIVQLIEIKKISGKYYEYIWQETRSGSNTVKTTARNGYKGTGYTNNVASESGTYEFTDYIPGNYIIRYIYGDGTIKDLTTDKYNDAIKNVTKYNGQDYKSTIDSNYTEEWFETSKYQKGQSVARDNEARRLEVMAYSSVIDKTKGEALERRNQEDLKNTWMCAETSKIYVPVDSESSPKATSTVSFGNMNFGLVERPKTNLVLEKHITGLKITPNGTGVQSIVDAKANIENIVNGTEVSTQGVTTGLATIKSTRDNRGFWQVATDIEELAQGAELEVEYTYVIRNDSEDDYLSAYLVGEYEKGIADGAYETLLANNAKEVKTATKGKTNSYGTYLGQWYYNGQKSETDKLVSSRVETLEEALNNDLTFDSTGTDFKKVNDDSAVTKKVYTVEGTNQDPLDKEIATVVQNTSASAFLTGKSGDKYTQGTDVDYSKTIILKTLLSSSNGGEIGANLPSYIAQVVKYSNAAGRRDVKAEPDNLEYVHSDDTTMTLDNSGNEHDEFWGETIIITKPTGEDKLSPMQIAIITVSSIAVLGVGIVLIKKFVLKK